jgi:hypothetical protein
MEPEQDKIALSEGETEMIRRALAAPAQQPPKVHAVGEEDPKTVEIREPPNRKPLVI